MIDKFNCNDNLFTHLIVDTKILKYTFYIQWLSSFGWGGGEGSVIYFMNIFFIR